MKWDKELPFICSELTGFEEAYISEVIKTCLTLGLFSKGLFDADGVLTSKGIQERYSRICIQCRRVCDISDYCLLESKVKKTRSSKAKQQKPMNTATAQQDTQPHYEPYSLTLDQEIEELKGDECCLTNYRSFTTWKFLCFATDWMIFGCNVWRTAKREDTNHCKMPNSISIHGYE